ncbi:MAG TPA: hypothetical protein VH280_21955 [Verrucomicrobiae bacterium]|jgi:hypothetical protein|nr:hypothetical protein [Verrucomicrobiae bacterium]
MLKRDGQLCKYTVPDFVGKLTSSEFDSYNEAFGVIKDEFNALVQVKDNLKELTTNPSVFAIPDDRYTNQSVQTQHSERGDLNLKWDIRSCLLKLTHSEILLCERMTAEGKQYGVVERYDKESPFAHVNGNARVLLVGDDPLEVVQDCAVNAEHTLRFMASNMVARAQTIVWQRYANQNPARVIRAISDRCARAVGEAHNEIQEQILEQRMARRMMQRQGMGQSV